MLKQIRIHWATLKGTSAFQRSPSQALLRIAAWRIHSWLGKAALIPLPRWNVNLRAPALWRGAGKMIYLNREMYEPELLLLEAMIESGDVIVDVGANLGIYTLVASRLTGPTGMVVAVEPTQDTFNWLNRNVQANHATNVRLFQIAISDESGHRRLAHHPDSSRNAFEYEAMRTGVLHGDEVITKTIEEVVTECSLTRMDLMKIDVEGAEELVLKGSWKILCLWHPTIILEINEQAVRRLGLEVEGCWTLLESLGYEFFAMSNKVGLEPITVWPEFGNIVALHPTRTPSRSLE